MPPFDNQDDSKFFDTVIPDKTITTIKNLREDIITKDEYIEAGKILDQYFIGDKSQDFYKGMISMGKAMISLIKTVRPELFEVVSEVALDLNFGIIAFIDMPEPEVKLPQPNVLDLAVIKAGSKHLKALQDVVLNTYDIIRVAWSPKITKAWVYLTEDDYKNLVKDLEYNNLEETIINAEFLGIEGHDNIMRCENIWLIISQYPALYKPSGIKSSVWFANDDEPISLNTVMGEWIIRQDKNTISVGHFIEFFNL